MTDRSSLGDRMKLYEGSRTGQRKWCSLSTTTAAPHDMKAMCLHRVSTSPGRELTILRHVTTPSRHLDMSLGFGGMRPDILGMSLRIEHETS